MQHINRRAILTGAATLPAMSIPAVAAENPKLLAIGEKIKALWPAYQEAAARSQELYEQTRELAGWNDPNARRQFGMADWTTSKTPHAGKRRENRPVIALPLIG